MMGDSLLDTPLTPEELRGLEIAREAYRPREAVLDIRPDLFTLDRRALEAEVRRLQLQCLRLAGMVSQGTKGPFTVYADAQGRLVAVVSTHEGKAYVYAPTISPLPLVEAGTFDADGVSDYNWGMVGVILGMPEAAADAAQLQKAKEINEKGL